MYSNVDSVEKVGLALIFECVGSPDFLRFIIHQQIISLWNTNEIRRLNFDHQIRYLQNKFSFISLKIHKQFAPETCYNFFGGSPNVHY